MAREGEWRGGGEAATAHGKRLAWALLLALAIMALAVGSTAAFWLSNQGRTEALEVAEFRVELAPTTDAPYQVFLPIPSAQGRAPQGFALRIEEGEPHFRLVRTEHGIALAIDAQGPVKLAGQGPFPVRLSLDDIPGKYRQFKFWAFLHPDAEAPVLVKLEVRARSHSEAWEQHVDLSRAIVVQEPLRPEGWQVVRATQLFDVAASKGYVSELPRVALGAVGASAAALYIPAGVVLLGALRTRGKP